MPNASASAQRRAATDRLWNEYLHNRIELLESIKHSGFKLRDALTCLDLEEADIADPVDPTAPGNRRADWDRLAGRVSSASYKWKQIASGDKGGIPFRAAALRGDAAATRLAQVEAYLTEFLTKLAAKIHDVTRF
jgi:hypothetical protein